MKKIKRSPEPAIDFQLLPVQKEALSESGRSPTQPFHVPSSGRRIGMSDDTRILDESQPLHITPEKRVKMLERLAARRRANISVFGWKPLGYRAPCWRCRELTHAAAYDIAGELCPLHFQCSHRQLTTPQSLDGRRWSHHTYGRDVVEKYPDGYPR